MEWESGGFALGTSGHRKFNPIALKPVALKPVETTPDLVLHNPILAKFVPGKNDVEEAVSLAHEVQSRSSYTSIIATPDSEAKRARADP